MNKVLTISLAGRSYKLEEEGFEALRRYLDDAREALADNPDRDEILSDLEAALGEKCAAYLSAHKDVVLGSEVATILKEMGPVSDAGGNGSQGTDETFRSAPKRLYRIREGEMIFGVCRGLAAYFDVDVALVRILFVLLAVLTGGGICLAYFLMMLIIPEAATPQERAAAFGGGPPTARQLIERARIEYARFSEGHWKARKHAWKAQRRAMRRARHWHYEPAQSWQRSPFWTLLDNLIGILWLVIIALVCAWAYRHAPFFHTFVDAIATWLNAQAQTFSHWLTGH